MKKAVALVIWKDADERQELLGVKRPEDDDDHPGMWGFPATSLDGGESWEDAVHRAAEEKLGVKVEIVRELSIGDQSREEFDIRLKNYEVKISEGEPEVPQPYGGTQYEDWKWMRPQEFRKTAETGSLCTSLLLDSRGVSFEMPANIDRSSVHHSAGLEDLEKLRVPQSVQQYPVGVTADLNQDIQNLESHQNNSEPLARRFQFLDRRTN